MGLGAGGLGLAAALRFGGPHPDPASASGPTLPAADGELRATTASSHAMGCEVSLTVFHDDPVLAQRAVTAALEEIRRIEGLASIYQPHSQLSELNRRGRLDRPDADLVELLRAAQDMAQQTSGAFDVTVQPLWDLYAAAAKTGGVPDAAALAAATRTVDWRRLEVAPQAVRLGGPGMAVTLNGIAQGFAADRAMAVLQGHGIRHALASAGEIAARGGKPDGTPWTVGVQHPRQADAYVELVQLQGRCLSTSGDYATTFTADHRLHHVFDPQSGRSPGHFASVSVVAPSATQADALSTAVFVLGPEKGLGLIRATAGADVLMVFKDGRVRATEGFPRSA